MSGKSPLKAKPLRNPSESIDDELQELFNDKVDPVFLFGASA